MELNILRAEDLHKVAEDRLALKVNFSQPGHLWQELNGSGRVLLVPLFFPSNSGEFTTLTQNHFFNVVLQVPILNVQNRNVITDLTGLRFSSDFSVLLCERLHFRPNNSTLLSSVKEALLNEILDHP